MPEITLTLQLHDFILLLVGFLLCYVLTKRGAGQPILPRIIKEKPVPEEVSMDNDLIRCQYSEEEEEMIREGRIPTRRG